MKLGKIKLGQTCKDQITGFAGVVTSMCQSLTGNDSVYVSKISDDGKASEHWFDIDRLVVLKQPSVKASMLLRLKKEVE